LTDPSKSDIPPRLPARGYISQTSWGQSIIGGNIEDRSSSRNEVELHTPGGLYNLYILGIYRANTVLLQTY